MPWDRVQKYYRQLTIRTSDPASIEGGIEEFWQLFAKDTVPEVAPTVWDYLLIDFRGIDERFGVYPQRLEMPPFQVSWASLVIFQMGYDYREITDGEDDGSRVELRYIDLMCAGAQEVNLAKLLGRNDAVLLRFVPYAEDKSQPLLERYLMPQ